MESSPPGALTHLDSRGAARMVDVADRPASDRAATAEGCLTMAPATLALVVAGTAPKGDVLAVARVAAIQGAKRTAELIPRCHPLPLAGVSVAIEPAADGSGLRLVASVRTTAPTGVEMEALTAVQVGLLTLYDMLKSADRAMTIGPVRLLEKRGGRHGPWRHPAADGAASGPDASGGNADERALEPGRICEDGQADG
ncbi:MAG: cyclic pyranopterin monophosphate synthase MoaC [Cyanobacteriota bacterium]